MSDESRSDDPQPERPASPLQLTSDERTWALAAHALTFVEGGILGPLVVYMIKKDESDFVAFHALQSLLFGLLFTMITVVVVMPLTVCTFGFGAFLLFFIAPVYLGFELYAVIKANEGEWYMLPIVGQMAWDRHGPGRPD